MLNLLNSLAVLLAQNEAEKRATLIGLVLFGCFMFYLILDSVIKQKFIPKNGALRGFLIFFFVIIVIAILVYIIFVK